MAAAARAGIRLEWHLSKQLNHEFLRAGGADLWPLADPENSHGFQVTRAWAREPYAMLRLMDYRGGDVLVAVNKAPRIVGLLKKHLPDAARLEVDGPVQSMAAMCKGESTHAFVDARVAQRLLLTRPSDCHGVPLRMEPAIGAELPLGIMYRPGFDAAAQSLRRAIDEMALNGSLADAFSKWSTAANSSVELDGLLLDREIRAARDRWAAGIAFALFLIAIALAATFYRARNLARETANAKSNFVAMVNHELRTPLNGFMGAAELLVRGRLDSDQRELADALRSSAQNFHRVVSHILEFSRIETGGLRIERTPCDLQRLVAAALANVEARAESKGLQVNLTLSGTIRPVLADGSRLTQVLTNLLENALKFTSEGSISLRVNAEPGNDSKQAVSIQVSDTGIGMETDATSGLFNAFRQAHQSQSRRFGGLGLGLAVCKGLVDAMDGQISLTSEPGLGTTVTVSMLFDVTTDLAQIEESEGSAARAPQSASAPRRVLVVDDGKVNRLLVVRILKALGYSTDEASNGRQAVELAAANEYVLILMDCQMPEMDGFEATRRIRNSEDKAKRVPIVALTASVEPVEQGQCFAAGMDAFLQKPVSVEMLRQVLAKYSMVNS